MKGRPNGMPSFRGRIPEDQIWQLVAYVRSLSGLRAASDAAPRGDDDPMRSRVRCEPMHQHSAAGETE